MSQASPRLVNKQRLKSALFVAAIVAALAAGAYQRYLNRDSGVNVRVECRPTKTNVECVAKHTKGKKQVKVCWTVRFQCADGVKPTARACANVRGGAPTTKLLSFSDFADGHKCKSPTGSTVTDLKLEY